MSVFMLELPWTRIEGLYALSEGMSFGVKLNDFGTSLGMPPQ